MTTLRGAASRFFRSPNFRSFRIASTYCIQVALLAHVFVEYGFSVRLAVGPSMLPIFEVYGDHLLISKSYRRGRGIKVGDIVEFTSVVDPREKAVKMVVGMAGDYVLRDTPGANDKMIQVPKGHCWVVGMNLAASRDSRMWGPLPLALINGKVIAKVLPFSERRWIENELQAVEE